jgi:hypothetical protein
LTRLLAAGKRPDHVLEQKSRGTLWLEARRGSAVTFAISDNDAEGTAFRKRSEFVFERPLSTQSIRNTLKPAYGLILRERRRYFRCPISIPVTVLRRNIPEVRYHGVNISAEGMALSTFVPLNIGEDVQIQFTLPYLLLAYGARSFFVGPSLPTVRLEEPAHVAAPGTSIGIGWAWVSYPIPVRLGVRHRAASRLSAIPSVLMNYEQKCTSLVITILPRSNALHRGKAYRQLTYSAPSNLIQNVKVNSCPGG